MKQIGFRLEDESYSELERRGKLAGVSVHEMARALILKALENEQAGEALRMELSKLGSGVSELRSDVSSVAALLMFVLGKVPPEQANQLIASTLRRAA